MVKLIPYKRIKVYVKIKESIDWGVKIIGAPDVWKLSEGADVSIAVLDTGSAPTHKDLIESFIYERKNIVGYNATGKGKENNIIDKQSHGTHCSGIIAANRNGIGIIGVSPKTKIIPVKVLNDEGEGDLNWIIKGIYWVLENYKKYKIKIISMSLGAPYGVEELRKALVEAKKEKLVCVCAVGNEGNWTDLGYPARYAEEKLCIAVGAIESKKRITEFSNTGKGMQKMGVVAPGYEILSTIPDNKYAIFSGTSMATPHISGILALAISKHLKYGGETPLTNLDEAYEHLKWLSEDIGKIGADNVYGIGLPVLTEEKFKILSKK
ncbi:MAG TPA: S8 family serine peptidase [bacterium]|nr:S8 family serine peptidase [bacterium]HPQ20162.1 S8 family serine peptidase [bacterium]